MIKPDGQRKQFDITIETLKRSLTLSLGLIVSVLNTVQVILILRIKRKKTLYEKCLLSLSIADLLFGLSNGVVSILYLTGYEHVKILYDLTYSVFLFCIFTSIFHILWISLDRLWAVVFPIHHNIKATGKKLNILLAITWAVTLLISATLFTLQASHNSTQENRMFNATLSVKPTYMLNNTIVTLNNNNSQFLLITSSPGLKLPTVRNMPLELDVKLAIAIMILCSDVVYISAYCFIIYGINHSNNKKKDSGLMYDANSERRMFIVCILVALAFVLSTGPFAISRLITGVTPMWANALLIINSGINSIVYFFRGRYQRKNKHNRKRGSTSSK